RGRRRPAPRPRGRRRPPAAAARPGVAGARRPRVPPGRLSLPCRPVSVIPPPGPDFRPRLVAGPGHPPPAKRKVDDGAEPPPPGRERDLAGDPRRDGGADDRLPLAPVPTGRSE